jgi:multidrug efflux pump subunit AcrA (membrane-fusion protein)
MFGRIVVLLKWPILLGGLAALFGVAYLVHNLVQAERKEEEAIKAPRRTYKGVVKLEDELIERHGIKDTVAREYSWEPRITVYGRVVANPRAAIEVRAPFAGLVRTAPGQAWPALGMRVQAGQALACLDIRIGPQERLDLQVKRNEARLKEKGAEKVVRVRQDRLNRLESASVSVSQAEVDTAREQVIQATTELATAREAVKLWDDALAEIDRPERKGDIWTRGLTVPLSGEVTEIAAAPGTAVEAGALIIRVVDFHKPLFRLDLPSALLAGGPPKKLEIYPAGSSQRAAEWDEVRDGGSSPSFNPLPPRSVWGTLVGPAAQVDAASQRASYWYGTDLTCLKDPPSISRLSALFRPGLFVGAYVKDTRAKPRPAVAVPASAILYHQGRPLVYLRIGPETYQRRPVDVLGFDGDAPIVTGVEPGKSVVYQQAQILLAEEFRPEVDND